MAAIIKQTAMFLGLLAVTWAYPFQSPSIGLQNLSPDEFARLLEEMQQEQPQPQIPVMVPVQVSPNQFNTDNQGLGQTTAVSVDSNGDLLVFHRADRPWTEATFEANQDVLSEEAKSPIVSDTIFKLNPETGAVISKFGANIFNVPHGLTVDKDDNIWVTDVGRHQVLKFNKGSTTPDLELGEKFVPGDKDNQFCKPTDVAVASNGDFFVSDGYCNSRILKFSKDGELIAKWGTSEQTQDSSMLNAFHMDIPHSVTLVEEMDWICVADRDNERANCFNAGLGNGRPLGSFNKTLIQRGDLGKVYALHYNQADKTVVSAIEISDRPFIDADMELTYPPRAATVSLASEIQEVWAPITPFIAEQGVTVIHDICVSKEGRDFFLADLDQQKVFKYTKPDQAYTIVQ